MNLVESCYAAMRERNALHEFSAVESHLLELARKQVSLGPSGTPLRPR